MNTDLLGINVENCRSDYRIRPNKHSYPYKLFSHFLRFQIELSLKIWKYIFNIMKS